MNMTLAGSVILVLAVVIATLALSMIQWQAVCESQVCQATSNIIKRNMNTSLNPCDDFYEYACGSFAVNHRIPDNKGRYDWHDVIGEEVKQILMSELSKSSVSTEASPLKYIRRYYQECSDEERPKREEMRTIDDLVTEVTTPRSSKEQAISRALNQTVSTFITASIVSDPDDPKKRILGLNRPTFTISRNDLVANESDTKAAALRSAYRKFIKAGLIIHKPEMGEMKAEEGASKISALEIELSKISTKDEDRRNWSQVLQRVAVDKLADEIKGINLKSIVKHFLGSQAADEVLIADMSYMKQLGQVLDANSDALDAYHTWTIIKRYGGLLSEKYTDARFEFYRLFLGLKKKSNQKEICINSLMRNVPSVIGRVYIDASNFTDADKRGVEKMIKRIKKSMKRLIEQKEWMDEDTKKLAFEKLAKMKSHIGYPRWIRNDTLLTKHFSLQLNEQSESSYTLLKRMRVFLKNQEIEKLNQPVDDDHEWWMSPAMVNAGYSPDENAITFPAAILRGVFYQRGLPDYYNYASIGATIGHEITHGFDDSGSQWNADGRLINWWTESSLEKFKSLTKQVVIQYSDIIDETTGLNLNGQNTQGENIADDGGLREAYSAVFESDETPEYELLPQLESFTPEQLFFISYANSWCTVMRPEELRQRINVDPHSPPKYRVNVPLMNSEKFSEAFFCPRGSRMNPKNKVRVW